MEKFEGVKRSLKDIAINNFVGGIMWGLGATIGLSLLLAIIGFVVGQIDWIPIIGDFVTKTNSYVLEKNPNLIR